jgi:hypothetical protein
MQAFISPSLAPGAYRLQVWANPAGAPFPGPANKAAEAYITVLAPGQPPPPPPPPGFDFSISAEPSSQSIRAGRSAEFKVAVGLISGTAQPVLLSLTGLPDEASYAFDPASGTPPFESLLTISTDAPTAAGTYPLTIIGEGDGLTRSASISLSIEAAEEAREEAMSSLSISVSPASIRLGESVSVAGELSPAMATAIKLIYRRPDGSELARDVAISASGAFSDSFKPDLAGAWAVRAAWAGDASHKPSESPPASFSVLEARPAREFWEAIPGGSTGLVAMGLIALGIAVAALALKGRGAKPPAEPTPPEGGGEPEAPSPTAAGLCPNCGAEYPEGSAFCPKCGEKL